MLVKIALIVAALGALFVMLRGKLSGPHSDNAPKKSRPSTLSSTKCQTCGIYLPVGESCDCADRT